MNKIGTIIDYKDKKYKAVKEKARDSCFGCSFRIQSKCTRPGKESFMNSPFIGCGYGAGFIWKDITDNKATKPTPFKPKYGDRFWCINEYFKTEQEIYEEWPSEDTLIKCGNCFRTRREAREVAKRFKEILRGVK